MTAITREFLELHLRHMDERQQRQTASNQREFDARFNSIVKVLDNRLASNQVQYDAFKQDMKDTVIETRKEARSLKVTVVLTGIGTAATIICGLAAFNASLVSNHIAGVGLGKQLGETAALASVQLKDTGALLHDLAGRQDRLLKQLEDRRFSTSDSTG